MRPTLNEAKAARAMITRMEKHYKEKEPNPNRGESNEGRCGIMKDIIELYILSEELIN